MKEIRIHGRGGQGAVMAARMLASAFVIEGKYIASFPMYGFERRGAPVVAFTRLDDKPVWEKTQVYNPDCLIVIDPTLFKLSGMFTGLKQEGILIANKSQQFDEKPDKNVHLAGVVNATQIALEEIGRDIPNTCLLGAFAAATKWLNLDSLTAALEQYFKGDILDKNIRSMKRGFNEVTITQWQ